MPDINENPNGNVNKKENLQYIISLIMRDCLYFGVQYPAGILRTTNTGDDYYFEYSDRLGYTLTFWERGVVNWGMSSFDIDGFRFLFQQHIILHNLQSIPDSVAFMQKAGPIFGRTEEYKEAFSRLKRQLGTIGIQLNDYLFIIPVAYEGEPEYQEKPDHELHFGEREAAMFNECPVLTCSDLPETFVPASAVQGRVMHYQTLQAPDGQRYIPLFTSYEDLKSVFGDKVRLGVICYETAREFVLKEGLAGIVVSPVSHDAVIPAADLQPRDISGVSEQLKENAEEKQQETNQLNEVCLTDTTIDELRSHIGRSDVSVDEIAGIILDIDRQFLRCDECNICRFVRKKDPSEHIAVAAHKISDILSGIDTEQYVYLINEISSYLRGNTSAARGRSLIPYMIDDYEVIMEDKLAEQAKVLQRAAIKAEFKGRFFNSYNKWVDVFLKQTRDWLRYVRPLISAAASQNTENSYVIESVKCLKELSHRLLYRNDEAVYTLTNAFKEYFADTPTVMEWVTIYNSSAGSHLHR